MNSSTPSHRAALTTPSAPPLERRLGLLQATALNMANMLGAGPFITLSAVLSALGGPQSMLGWFIAVLITLPDGMIWAELGAALPGSGGTFRYLREGFGAQTWGRLMAFLFLAQLLVSGPLEIASGFIGFLRYADYLWQGVQARGWSSEPLIRDDLPTRSGAAVILVLGISVVALLYRRIGSVGRLMVALWMGVVLTMLIVLIEGALHFNPKIAFALPPNAFHLSYGFFLGLGVAARTGIYDLLGYYDICYLGDEVKNPDLTIPRSILWSLGLVTLMYVGFELSVIGVLPWQSFVPESAHPESMYVVSAFMEHLHGPAVARWFTVLILWTCFGGSFALLLGYSRIPYAAAQEGVFFRVFGRLHPRGGFPHLALLLLGGLSVAGSFLRFGVVLDTLIALRIVVQFLGQIGAVILLRKHQPNRVRPYRVWFYPIPLVVAGVGWLFALGTTPSEVLWFSLGALIVGVITFLVWSWQTAQWPFKGRNSTHA